jgi:polyhydroxybutyrate depolymerase
VAFITELLSTMDRKLCFDRNRIFVSGGSNGGGMASVLACESARSQLGPHKIAAIAPVAMAPGFPWNNPHSPICPELLRASVPTRVIVANKDELLALVFLGNVETLNATLRTAIGTWARDNGCTAGSQDLTTGNTGCGVLAKTVNYACSNVASRRADTVLDIFDSTAPGCKGHIWPGLQSGSYQATDAILKFFLDHPR